MILFIFLTICIKKSGSVNFCQMIFHSLPVECAIAITLSIIHSSDKISIQTVNIYNNYAVSYHNLENIKNSALLTFTKVSIKEEKTLINCGTSILTKFTIADNSKCNLTISFLNLKNVTRNSTSINVTKITGNIINTTMSYNDLFVNKFMHCKNNTDVDNYYTKKCTNGTPLIITTINNNITDKNGSKIISLINGVNNYNFKNKIDNFLNFVSNNWFIKKLNKSVVNVCKKKMILKSDLLDNHGNVISETEATHVPVFPILNITGDSNTDVTSNVSALINVTVHINSTRGYLNNESANIINEKNFYNISDNNRFGMNVNTNTSTSNYYVVYNYSITDQGSRSTSKLNYTVAATRHVIADVTPPMLFGDILAVNYSSNGTGHSE